MKYINYFLAIFIIITVCSSCKSRNVTEEEGRLTGTEQELYRTPSRSDIAKMEEMIRQLIKSSDGKIGNIHLYNLGKNLAVFACELTASGSNFPDGCEISLFIFERDNKAWNIKAKNISLGKDGAYGNCFFSRDDLMFYTEGKNIVGSFYTSQNHGGTSHGVVVLMFLEKNAVRFSQPITVEESNGGYVGLSPEYYNTESEFYFEGRGEPVFRVVSTVEKSGKKFNQTREFILAGNEFKERENEIK